MFVVINGLREVAFLLTHNQVKSMPKSHVPPAEPEA